MRLYSTAQNRSIIYHFYLSYMEGGKQVEREITFDETLLKSKRQHYQKQTEKLLDYVMGEYSELDKMSIIGKRFREKQVEFQILIKENEQLRLRTFNMTKQIENLRISLGDSGIRYTNMLNSIQRTQRDDVLASKHLVKSINMTTEQSVRLQLQQIDGNLEQARKNYKEFDELLLLLIKYVTRSKAADKLRQEMQPQNQRDNRVIETVCVPKERYEKLIEIYSWNVAQITASQMHKEINRKDPSENVASSINYIEQSQRVYIQSYGNLLKGERVDLKDLNQLFSTISKKLDLQQQWKRYHFMNTQAAVVFASNINKIMKQNIPIETGIDTQHKRSLLKKVNELVKFLDFTQQQKVLWATLNKKIEQDELITIAKLMNQIQQSAERNYKSDVTKLSQILAYTLRISMQKIEQLFKKKFSGKNLLNWPSTKEFDAKVLQLDFSTGYKDPQQGYKIILEKKLAETYQKIQKNLIFISNKTIQNINSYQK